MDGKKEVAGFARTADYRGDVVLECEVEAGPMAAVPEYVEEQNRAPECA